jgi:hypothetical protein
MTIEEKDFRLTPSTNTADPFHWDLELLVTVKGVNGPRQELKNVAYGLSLPNACQQIANYRVMHKHPKDALSLAEYVNLYKEEVDKIIKMCKEFKI